MINITDLSVQFAGRYLFDNVNLRINKADKIALVGANGTGKSTLLKLLAGIERPEKGVISKQKNLRFGYLPQEFIELRDQPLIDEVRSSMTDISSIEKKESELYSLLNSDLPEPERENILFELGEISRLKEELNFYSANSKIKKILGGLGFKESDFGRRTGEFSGGWLMRIELAKILLGGNDLLLLDEPTNHLDIDSLEWLLSYLSSFRGALVIVSHDKHFINSVTNRTLEIYNEKLTYFKGNYNDYLNFKAERDRQLLSEYQNQQRLIKDTERFIERFRYKNTKARQVQSRIKFLEKMDKISIPDHEVKIDIRFPAPPRSGSLPVVLRNISMNYGNLEVFRNVELEIEQGDKIALVGPNGAGKTTLSKIIAAKLIPSSGEIKFSPNTIINYYSQEVAEQLNSSNDILEELYRENDTFTPLQLRSLLGSFLFSDDDVFKKISVLSGGEKSRVALAKILLTKANLIILDEPTNHLDMASKNVLQNALENFEGSLIIVSHDVDFLEPIVNKTLDIRDNSASLYFGGIDYYLSKRKLQSDSPIKDNAASNNLKPNKKEQKRLEAERRQQRYDATKNIKDAIANAEILIEDLESNIREIEHDLTRKEIYSDPITAADKSKQLKTTREKLETAYEEWTELSHKLELIEKEFTD